MKGIKIDAKLVCVIITSLFLFWRGIFSVYITSPLWEIDQALRQGGISTTTERVHIVSVMSKTPAEAADIREGDVILTVNKEPITSPLTFIEMTRNNKGKQIDIMIERNGTQLTKSVTPRTQYPTAQGPLGVSITNREIQKVNVVPMIVRSTIDVYTGKNQPTNIPKYARLLTLCLSVFFIALAVGLLRFKKWAMYGLFTLSLITTVSFAAKAVLLYMNHYPGMNQWLMEQAPFTVLLAVAGAYLFLKRITFK